MPKLALASRSPTCQRMRRTLITLIGLCIATTTAARAQTVRGTVTDKANDRLLASVQISLVDATGAQVGAGTRTDTVGTFVTHAARAGRYRIRAARIGYQPVVTDPFELQLGQLVVIRIQMTTVPQQLATVRIVERRRLHANELMTPAGFDLRRSRGMGTFLDASQLAAYGAMSTSEVLRGGTSSTWIRTTDNGDLLTLLKAGMPEGCAPEILLDGLPLSSGDTMETISGRGESALATLAGYSADQLYGIEIYRDKQLPPPSVAGLMGIEQRERAPEFRCGVVAVWTKNSLTRAAMNPLRLDGSAAVQVIRGVVIDYDTNRPITTAHITLVDETGRVLADPAPSDSTGWFSIRTKRGGAVKLQMAGTGFRSALSPVLRLSPDEVVFIKLFVSGTQPVMTPMGVAARLSPSSFAPRSLTGFTYRRERALAGHFLAPADAAARRAATIGELLGGTGRDVAAGAPNHRRRDGSAAERCEPTWFLNGALAATEVIEQVRTTPVAALVGIEIYERTADAPDVFAEAVVRDCRIVGVWTTAASR